MASEDIKRHRQRNLSANARSGISNDASELGRKDSEIHRVASDKNEFTRETANNGTGRDDSSESDQHGEGVSHSVSSVGQMIHFGVPTVATATSDES